MRIYDVGGGDEPRIASRRVLTIPNLLSFARLAVLPFVYLDLANDRFTRAFVLVAVFAATDWLDGYLARRLDQVTELGTLLDPISDRVLFVVVGVGFVVSGLLPLWAVLILVVRDVLVGAAGVALLVRGATPPPVTRLGKTATFGLMWALPMFLLAAAVGEGAAAPQPVLHALAWVLFAINAVLYWLSAFDYARTLRRRSRAGAGEPGAARPGRD